MQRLAASLQGDDAALLEETRPRLRQKMRTHLGALLRLASTTERLLRAGKTPTGIPRYAEMSSTQWMQSNGPFHVGAVVPDRIFSLSRFGGWPRRMAFLDRCCPMTPNLLGR